jgi:predicted metal-dependent hydrolase
MIPAVAIGGTAIALAYSYLSGPKNNTLVKASDGRSYKVQELPDKQDAAERMSSIRNKLEKICEHCKDEKDNPYQRLVSRFNPDVLEENDLTADSTSYSENKGEKIVVCLRDKAPPFPLVEENTVMFVLIHELAHLMTASIGHTPEFWTNMRMLLQDCIKIGVYTSVNYSKNPVKYCGMTISDTPL